MSDEQDLPEWNHEISKDELLAGSLKMSIQVLRLMKQKEKLFNALVLAHRALGAANPVLADIRLAIKAACDSVRAEDSESSK
jgi:hypothetical protein